MRFEILEQNIHIYHTMQINLCIYIYTTYIKYGVYWACYGLLLPWFNVSFLT